MVSPTTSATTVVPAGWQPGMPMPNRVGVDVVFDHQSMRFVLPDGQPILNLFITNMEIDWKPNGGSQVTATVRVVEVPVSANTPIPLVPVDRDKVVGEALHGHARIMKLLRGSR